MGTQTTNTFQEGLQKLLKLIAELQVEPDADMQFCAQLQAMVVGKLREPIDRMAQQGLTAAPPQPQQQGGFGPSPAMGGGANGLPPSLGTGNVDEMRRMLSQ